MAVLKKRDVVRCLTGKLECTKEETHHTFYYLEQDGVLISYTYVSHGSGKDLDDYLIGKMAKQLGITKTTFRGAVACTKSRADVIEEVESRA